MDFFLDSKLCKKPPLARIAFEGLWVYADKKGVLEEDLERLKAQILPYDKVNFDHILAYLCPDHILRYELEGHKLIWIRNFLKYQKPHPSEWDCGFPLPSKEMKENLISCNYKKLPEIPGVVVVGVGVGVGVDVGVGVGVVTEQEKLIFSLWNEMASKSCGVFPVVRALSKDRSAKCALRSKQLPEADWRTIIEKVSVSKWCRGEVKDRDGKSWRATFDWLIDNDKNALKVLEGNYDNRESGNGSAPVPGKYKNFSGRRSEKDEGEAIPASDSGKEKT